MRFATLGADQPSTFAHEQDGLRELAAYLPDRDPFHVWANVEFVATDGSISEIDALVLRSSGLYVVCVPLILSTGFGATTVAPFELDRLGPEGVDGFAEFGQVPDSKIRLEVDVDGERREFPKRLDTLRQPFDPVRLLASGDSQVYRPIVPSDRRPATASFCRSRRTSHRTRHSRTSSLVTRTSSKATASRRWPGTACGEGNWDVFLGDRTEFLAKRLRRFATEISVPLSDLLVGIADDDTE